MAEIQIKGVIGDVAYEGEEKTTLIDVVNQVNAAKDDKEHTFIIDSVGGDVDTGFAIAEYIESLPNTTTVAKHVYSIATVIFLAGKKRIANSESVFMIHNPWTDVAGDSEQLRRVANELDQVEARIETFYQQKTGVESNVLSELMRVETFFDAHQAQNIGFVNTIENRLKAVAFYSMKNDSNKLLTALQNIINKFSNQEHPEKEDEKEEMIENALSLEDGSYQLKDGRSITVENGAITAISEGEEEELEKEETMNKEEVNELVDSKFEAKFEAMFAKFDEKIQAFDKAKSELAEVENQLQDKFQALAQVIKTSYKAPEAQTQFAEKEQNAPMSAKDAIKALRKSKKQ